MTSPLWRELALQPQLAYRAPSTDQLAAILSLIADHIEQRGAQGLDLDPGETSDWLRQEVEQLLADS